MPRAAVLAPPASTSAPHARRRRLAPAAVLGVAVALLVVVGVASLAIGTRQVPFDVVLASFTSPTPGDADQDIPWMDGFFLRWPEAKKAAPAPAQ